MTKRMLPTKIERHGFATIVLSKYLSGSSVYGIVKELNALAHARAMGVTFSQTAVENFLQRCGLAYSIYQQNLVKKTLEPVINVVQEAANSIARLVRAAEGADNQKDIKSLATVSRELHNGLRLLAEMQKKLAPPEIHITQVNAILMGLADKIEQADTIPLPHRRSVIRMLAESLPEIGRLSGVSNAKTALAKPAQDT